MSDSSDTIAAICAEHPSLPGRGRFPAGTRFGEWQLTAFIGRGGSGEVYCAKHVLLGTPAAVKILVRTEDRARERFKREAELLWKLKSPSFPQFYSFDESNGFAYLAMELLEQRELPTGERAVADFLCRICAVVAELHAKGLVHRDIKPSNILWRGAQPVLADLGLLKDVSRLPGADESLTRIDGRRVCVGTPGYAAPEQMERGEATVASDIHALGVLADTCFDGNPPKAWLPIIQRATSSIPSHRYSSVSALARAIRYRNFARYRLLLYPVLAVVGALCMLLFFRRDFTTPPVGEEPPGEQPPAVKPATEKPRALVPAANAARYCVIDLSGGTNAASYPVTYLAEPPEGGFNTDEYKTTKLALRRIEAGSFIMGDDPANESHRVTLTRPFYMGIFEVTQKQYELVKGNNPSHQKGDTRPVDWVSYANIRGLSKGKHWPVSSDVDASVFMGKLRARTGLEFDLPTEAQWEYACRAGTTSRYNNGGSAVTDLKLLGRFNGNTSDGKGGYSQHTTVGLYQPNAWGLYDMHGNVREWCLDRYGELSYGTDPVGALSRNSFVSRGGSWQFSHEGCRADTRSHIDNPDWCYDVDGFRICRTIDPENTHCVVTFDANGGIGSMAPQQLRRRLETLHPCTFTRKGYSFAGWATEANGAVVYEDGAAATWDRDLTLYAVWKPAPHKGVDLSGGTNTVRYCVVDLSDGPSAASYPVSFLAAEPAGWTKEKGGPDEYKTTKLVLRRIEAGSFNRGVPVTLTRPFFMGVFEVTQRQYSLVTGMNPSAYKGDMRPVEKVSYDAIRGSLNGTNWPASSAVDASSFLGRIRACTGLEFDLPTEAQWEYACFTGIRNDIIKGVYTATNDLKLVARYKDNQSDGKGGYSNYHTTVGSYLPDAWGLYDMRGNIYEWCRDWIGNLGGTDPKGAAKGECRVGRGGSWLVSSNLCTWDYQNCLVPSVGITHYGFRLVCSVPE
ncbi:MAG: SUMF1/EgtB/PvdO family nonheme iron enzyme [Kiritimatiellae bacterium]|nr:SUMF1/EgtB/PvdO family nonheme iron enzyme [Kiritimatiellia bacterium]